MNISKSPAGPFHRTAVSNSKVLYNLGTFGAKLVNIEVCVLFYKKFDVHLCQTNLCLSYISIYSYGAGRLQEVDLGGPTC